MSDRKLLRLSATLLFISILVSLVAAFLHPNHEDPNNYVAVFTEYAHSTNWTAVHLLGFIGTAILIAGLLVLFYAMNLSEGTPRWIGFFAAISAGVTLALAGVQNAVDGVALKQAVDAWAGAPAAEQAARFASAEAIRWLEWGAASYANFMIGLTLVLFSITIVWTARVSRPVGYLMGLAGLGFIGKGWVLGMAGFAPIGAVPSNIAQVALGAGILWLLIAAWLRKGAVEPLPYRPSPDVIQKPTTERSSP